MRPDLIVEPGSSPENWRRKLVGNKNTYNGIGYSSDSRSVGISNRSGAGVAGGNTNATMKGRSKIQNDLSLVNDNTAHSYQKKIDSIKYPFKPAYSSDKESRELDIYANEKISNWLISRADILSNNKKDMAAQNLDTSGSARTGNGDELFRQLKRLHDSRVVLHGTKDYIDENTSLYRRRLSEEGISDDAKKVHLDGIRRVESNEWLKPNAIGYYSRNTSGGGSSYIRGGDYLTDYGKKSTAIHEETHGIEAHPQLATIRKILNEENVSPGIGKPYKGGINDDYFNSPAEIYSRLMEFRINNNIDPKKIFTENDIDDLYENAPMNGMSENIRELNEYQKFLDRYGDNPFVDIRDNKNINIFDKINRSRHIKEQKSSVRRKINSIKGNTDVKDSGIINRYNKKVVRRLLNEVADNSKYGNVKESIYIT